MKIEASKTITVENNIDKEKWINDVLGSLDGMRRVPADPQMYEKAMSMLRHGPRSGEIRKLPLLRITAAAVLLLAINIASVVHFSGRARAAQQLSASQVISENINSLSDDSF